MGGVTYLSVMDTTTRRARHISLPMYDIRLIALGDQEQICDKRIILIGQDGGKDGSPGDSIYELRVDEGEELIEEGLDIVKIMDVKGQGKRVSDVRYYPWERKYEVLVN